ELYIVTLICFWLIYRSIVGIKIKSILISKIDLIIIIFFIYNISNFYLLSYFKSSYTSIWLFSSYIFMIYFFKSLLQETSNGTMKKDIFKFFLILISMLVFLESLI